MLLSNRFYYYIRLALFALYFVNGVIYINSNSVVSDESEHLNYGLRVLKGQPQKVRFDDASTQPISAFNALPRAVEQVLKPGLKKKDWGISDTIHGRYITLIICMLIGLYVYWWSKELFGEKAGLFSLFLFVFCPNIQANIPLVGTDAYAMLFTLTAAYYFRKFILYSGWRNFILFSIQIGLAFVVKQSLFLLPVFFSIISLVVLIKRRSLIKKFKLNLLRMLVLLFIILFIINAAFFFIGTGRALNQYAFKSDTFQSVQQKPFSNIPLPLPAPFVEGFDQVKYMLSIGSGHDQVSPKSYLFGTYFTGNKLWYYYSVVLFFKTPLTVLLMFVLVLISCIKKLFSRDNFFNTAFPLSLALFFLFFISFNNTSQHGIRHLIMIYPLFYVIFGQLINWKIFNSRIALLTVGLYSLVTFYSYFPNLLSYTNELIWDKKKAYKVMASTNIDHGQCGYSLKKYLEKHPATQYPGTAPQAGEFIIGINEYLDLKETGKYTWLKNFEPDGHVSHCYLLFRITEKDLEQKHLK